MAKDGPDMTCFRLSPDQHQAIREYCLANGTSVTDLYKALTEAVLNGTIAPGPAEGYRQARELAMKLALAMLTRAQDELPETLDEAIARYGLIG